MKLWRLSRQVAVGKLWRGARMATKSPWKTSAKGAFERDISQFRNWIENKQDATFPPEKDRYHLYVSLACPWASRCLMTVQLKGLQDVISVSIVHPVFQRTRPEDPNDTHAGWAFVDPKTTPFLPGPTGIGKYSSEGAIPDTVNHVKYVRDLYELCTDQPMRYTVPVLWDKKTQTIVSNESADIVRMLNEAFNEMTGSTVDLYPKELRAEIDEINDWIYNDISNGVYKCGFATSQEAYDEAFDKLFTALDRVEAILDKQRYLTGKKFTEADLRLFTTLVRFDEVYFVHFKTNKRMIREYPNLINFVRDIYQMDSISKTVNMQHIKLHYYASHTHINPLGLVANGTLPDFSVPHDRARFD